MRKNIDQQMLQLINEIENVMRNEANDIDGNHKIDSSEYDKRLIALRAQLAAADPASKLARELPLRIQNLEKRKQSSLNKTESAPAGKGWEKTVKAMKKHPEISNPFALAHWMKKKGYKPKKK